MEMVREMLCQKSYSFVIQIAIFSRSSVIYLSNGETGVCHYSFTEYLKLNCFESFKYLGFKLVQVCNVIIASIGLPQLHSPCILIAEFFVMFFFWIGVSATDSSRKHDMRSRMLKLQSRSVSSPAKEF